MKAPLVLLLLTVGVVVAFFAGRLTAAGGDDDDDDGPNAARARAWLQTHAATSAPLVRTTAPNRLPPATEALPETPAAPAEAACREVVDFGERCVTRLRQREQELGVVEAQRVEREGTPIAARERAPAPRFEQPATAPGTWESANACCIAATSEGVDCSEYPCILFGRIHGGEEEIEKVEKTRSLDSYDDDILTILLWTATRPRKTQHVRGEDGVGLEQSLFAAALYPVADQTTLGDNLDRRIRSRTAELWNTTAPTDETGRSP